MSFPHEQTLSGPKLDRLMLIRATNANLSPIFGLYPDENASVQKAFDDVCLKLTPSQAKDHLGVIHRLWVDQRSQRHRSGESRTA